MRTIFTLSLALLFLSNVAAQPLVFKGRIGFVDRPDKIVKYQPIDNGKKLLILGKQFVQIWDVETREMLDSKEHNIPGAAAADMSLLINKQGTKAVFVDTFTWRIIRKEKKVSAAVFDLLAGRKVGDLERPTESIRDAEWSENGEVIVTYSSESAYEKKAEVCFWTAEDLKLRSCVMSTNGLIFRSLSHDGSRFIASNLDGSSSTVEFFDTMSGRRTDYLTGVSHQFMDMWNNGMDKRQKYIAAHIRDDHFTYGVRAVWAIDNTVAPIFRIEPSKKDGTINWIGFSESGNYALSRAGRQISIYESATGKLLDSVRSPYRTIENIRLLGDDRTLAITSCGETTFHDIRSDREMYRISTACKYEFALLGDAGYLYFDVLRPDPSGRYFLTSSSKAIRIWDRNNGQLLQTLATPEREAALKKNPKRDDGLTEADWTPDGRYLYALAGDAETLLLWEAR